MSTYKLAHVQWVLGQSLLPAHLQAEADALDARGRLERRLSGMPSYGFARLAWDADRIAAGVLSISSLTAVFPTGTVVDAPGNASLTADNSSPANFDLNIAGRLDVTVFLHLLSSTITSAGNPAYRDDEAAVVRVIWRLALSQSPTMDGSLDVMRLGEFARQGSRWAWRSEVLPPLLLSGLPNPFLLPFLRKLEPLLDRLRAQIEGQIAQGVAGERKRALLALLAGVDEVLALVEDTCCGMVAPHPYLLHGALRTLYHRVSAHMEVAWDRSVPAYDHADPGPAFKALYDRLAPLVSPPEAATRERAFTPSAGQLVVSPLPDGVATSSAVYLVVQPDDAAHPIEMEGLKLGSALRIAAIRRQVLRGVPFVPVPMPAGAPDFGAGASFYRMQTADSPEWTQVLRDDSLAVYPPPSSRAARFSLYWT